MAKDMKVKDYVAQMQSGRSFVKAKMDSAGIGKVHLSFVEHSGRPKCEQVAAIEGYLNFEGAGSVSQLYYLVMSRDIRKKYANSVKTARETGSKYPNAIWDSNGGSSEKRDANGNVIKPCRYYAVQVSPGSKSDIVLQVMEGEGEVTETGGYMLKKGATVKRINVPFTFLDFCAFVVDIHDAVAAYKSVHAQLGYTGSEMKKRSVAYAASFGDPHFTDETYKVLNDRLQNFNAFGLREKLMVPYVTKHTNVPVKKVVRSDPPADEQ